MNIELSTQCDLRTIIDALMAIEATVLRNQSDMVLADIAGGAVSVAVYVEDPPSSTVTENFENAVEWKVGYRISFQYHGEAYDTAVREIRRFVAELANRSAADFVLSFQYEEVYALRDVAGLHYLRNF